MVKENLYSLSLPPCSRAFTGHQKQRLLCKTVSVRLERNQKPPTCPSPTSVVSMQYQKCRRCYARRDLSFLSRKRNVFAICISELLSCPSMLYVCCLKCVIRSRVHCSLADVGLSPTNMDYVKAGSELTRIC